MKVYNFRDDKVSSLFNELRNQIFYSELRELLILNFSTVKEIKEVSPYTTTKFYSSKIVTNSTFKSKIKGNLPKNRYHYMAKPETNLYGPESGITSMVYNFIKTKKFQKRKSSTNGPKKESILLPPSIKEYTKIAEACQGILKFMKFYPNASYKCIINPNKMSYKQLVDGALENLDRNKDIYSRMIKDLRVRSLLTDSVEYKTTAFETVKAYCTFLEEFVVPIYYFERNYKRYNQVMNNQDNFDEYNEYFTLIDKVKKIFYKFRIFRFSSKLLRIWILGRMSLSLSF